jgi:hypothetical protein
MLREAAMDEKRYRVTYTGSEVIRLGGSKFMNGTVAFLDEAAAKEAAAMDGFIVEGLDSAGASKPPVAAAAPSPQPVPQAAPAAPAPAPAKAAGEEKKEEKKPEAKAEEKKPAAEEKKAAGEEKKAADKPAAESAPKGA